MAKDSADNLKSLFGLEFLSASTNLAQKSITNWQNWSKVPLPFTGTDKLLFIDNMLRELLAPLQHRPNDRMNWRTRPDLNKYRGWLLHKVLQHQLSLQNGTDDRRFILPEDLPKIVDDLYLFHKHHGVIGDRKGPDAATIQHYKSLAELSDAVKPYAPQYPLTSKERLDAHKKFLSEHGGNSHATLLGVLKDGTEIIQVHSELASIAYGSPRWCTAYRNEPTYFSSYKDNLLVIVEPDGRRWQIHFKSGQLRDENDNSIKDFSKFCAKHEGMGEILTPYWEKAFAPHLRLALSIPAFKQRALAQDGTLHAALEPREFGLPSGDKRYITTLSVFNIADALKSDPDFQAFLEPYIFDRTLNKAGSKGNFEEAWKTTLSVPAWKNRALGEAHFANYLTDLLNGTPFEITQFLHMAESFNRDADIINYIFTRLSDAAFDSFERICGTRGYDINATMELYKFLKSTPEWKEKAGERELDRTALSLVDKTFAYYAVAPDVPYNPNGHNFSLNNNYIDFCMDIRGVPLWENHAREKGYIAAAVTEGHLGKLFDKYEAAANNNKFFGFTSKDYIYGLWKNVLSIPEWREQALKENRLAKMLEIIFTPRPKGLGFFASKENRTDPAKTFMFMMPLFYNQSEFRDALTPYISAAFEQSIGQETSFKIKRSKGRKTLIITDEILKYAANYKPWSDQITTKHLEIAMTGGEAIAGVLTLGKKWASSHWARAVMASDIVENYFDRERYPTYDNQKVREVIASHPPYQKAYGRFLTTPPPQSP